MPFLVRETFLVTEMPMLTDVSDEPFLGHESKSARARARYAREKKGEMEQEECLAGSFCSDFAPSMRDANKGKGRKSR